MFFFMSAKSLKLLWAPGPCACSRIPGPLPHVFNSAFLNFSSSVHATLLVSHPLLSLLMLAIWCSVVSPPSCSYLHLVSPLLSLANHATALLFSTRAAATMHSSCSLFHYIPSHILFAIPLCLSASLFLCIAWCWRGLDGSRSGLRLGSPQLQKRQSRNYPTFFLLPRLGSWE